MWALLVRFSVLGHRCSRKIRRLSAFSRSRLGLLTPAFPEQGFEPLGCRTMPNDAASARNGHEARRSPTRRGVVDPNTIECRDSSAQVAEARMIDRADRALRGAVAAWLRSLEDAPDLLVDRVRGHEPHLGRETRLSSEISLLDQPVSIVVSESGSMSGGN